MQTFIRTGFTTVKTEGAILPADLLQRITEGRGVEGLTPADYHLAGNERLNEAINRAWNRCLGAWASFDHQHGRLPVTDTGTTLTRERWLLILFQELGYGRLQLARGLQVGDESYPISHLWGLTPMHLVSFRQDLDRRGEGRGPTARSPHSLVQEFLNRSPDHLWGFIANGLRLRILHDNVSLTRAAYVEFDLQAMMDGELYADFTLLWLLCHQSRVEGDKAASCWLERWSKAAAEQGTRALDSLRHGVQEAIAALGRGFLAHSANGALKARLKSGELSLQDYYRQLLRLVYRLIFLFVAEDRDLLLVPDAAPEARRRYLDHYSLRHLRGLAEGLRGGPHIDLYRGLRLVFGALREGYAPLGLPALGSFLFSERATPDLDGAELANGALLEAVRALAFTAEGGVRRPVDYRNLGSEELGSVYESLLELHPQLNADAAVFELSVAAGSERKTTGSYYTPASLINCLLDSALEPVVTDRLAEAGKELSRSRITDHASRVERLESAILSIRVVDPACGSGHFLIAAGHRLARHLAQVRWGDEEPSPGELRAALRDVVSRCIHGVDINEMAVELCKVGLWLETLDPGRPLSFLERNIQCGNSLIGATPAVLRQGIPDEAFIPIEGDDKAYCSTWKKRNRTERKEREQQATLFDIYAMQPWERLGDLAAGMMSLEGIAEDTVQDVQRKQTLYEKVVRSDDYQLRRRWADAWCGAFVWRKTKEFAYPITEGIFWQIERNPHNLVLWMKEEIERLREQYQFLHWHVAFPHVFRVPGKGEEPENEQAGWSGGFDVVLGNPPWERIKLQEKEWFAARRPDIAKASNAAQRRGLIRALPSEDTALYSAFLSDRRQAEAGSGFVRLSGRYPLCGRGDVNTYAVFAELARSLQSGAGRAGIIVPSGIATDDTTKHFFQDLMERRALASLYDFENRRRLFPAVDSRMKFCLLTLTGTERPAHAGAEYVFFAHAVEDLADEERRFTLTRGDLQSLSPVTGTVVAFRTREDKEIALAVHERLPYLGGETGPAPAPRDSGWYCQFTQGTFHSSNDSSRFADRTKQATGGDYIRLYQPRMLHQYDHRFATYNLAAKPVEATASEHIDPAWTVSPRYWAPATELSRRTGRRDHWVLTYRRIARSTDERTMIAAIIPTMCVNENAVMLTNNRHSADTWACLLANLCAFVLDYVLRQHDCFSLANADVKQLPVVQVDASHRAPLWCGASLHTWVSKRALELTYTAWDLQPFAQDCGYDGPPFRWDEARRFLLRCELDAAYFHLYRIARDDVDYIMETFPIVKRKDVAAYGEYRTKRVILEVYDAMQRATETGEPYQTLLDPPPADPRVAHGPR